MVFPIAGGTQDTSYEISNSLRFNDDDSARLTLDPGTSTNNKKCTLSFWAKIGVPTSNGTDYFFSNHADGNNRVRVHISNTGEFAIFGKSSGSTFIDLYTNAQYRDSSAWYHFLVRVDSTDGTANNRLKLYVNGTLQTDVTQGTNPDQNADVILGSQDNMTIGAGHSGSAANSNPYDGYLAEMHFLDGTAYDASYFGETNDNGVWIPKQYTGGNYGTNGFYMEFKQTGTSQNSSGIGADTSGQDNHFAVTNLVSTDVTVDTPTNNFATMNPLSPTSGNPVYAEGNLKISASGTDAYSYFPSTFGLSNGKWYVEVKVNSQGGNTFIGIAETSMEAYNTGADNDPHLTAGTIWYANGGNGYYDGSSQNSSTFGAASFTSGDIIGLALDLDSGTKTIKFYKNNTLTATKNLTSNFVDPIVFAANLYNTQNQSWNFGNPDFSISSGNADANGYGNFEYAPPSGYYACCTKNLAEYG
jgi:hypothetical protein